jgi:prolyl-tRNA synthetase
MGCFGIGITRLMGVTVEALADEKGIVWPTAIAPFAAHLVMIPSEDGAAKAAADALYEKLQKAGVEVLYDDRDLRAGEKFADSDLIGIPTRIVVSAKTVEAGRYEVADRKTGGTDMMSEEELLSALGNAGVGRQA